MPSVQWRTKDFRMGGVEVLQAMRGGVWGGGIRHWGKGMGRWLSPENFSYFLLKIPYFDAFWHVYFLNHTTRGSNPLTPSSVRGTPLVLMIWRSGLPTSFSALRPNLVLFKAKWPQKGQIFHQSLAPCKYSFLRLYACIVSIKFALNNKKICQCTMTTFVCCFCLY